MTGLKTAALWFALIIVGFFLYTCVPNVNLGKLKPVIVSQNNKDLTIRRGLSLTMSVKAYGDNITYYWYKTINKADTLISDTSNTLKLDSLKDSDQGNYYCIAENEWGNDTSEVFEIFFPPNTNPRWLVESKDTCVNETDTLFLCLEKICIDLERDTLVYKILNGDTNSPKGDTIITVNDTSNFYRYAYVSNDPRSFTREIFVYDLTDDPDALDSLTGDTLKLQVKVNNLNPLWSPDTIAKQVLGNTTLSLPLYEICTDPEGDTIDYTILAMGDPLANDSIIKNNDSVMYYFSPPKVDSGYYKVYIEAKDRVSDTMHIDTSLDTTNIFYGDTLCLLLTVKNYNPRWNADIISGKITETDTYHLNLSKICSDPEGDSIVYMILAWNNPLAGATIKKINDSSFYEYTSTYDDSGDYSIYLEARDLINTPLLGESSKKGVSTKANVYDTLQINLKIENLNRKPIFIYDSTYIINEGDILRIPFSAHDADGDKITYTLVSNNLPRPETIMINHPLQIVTWQSLLNDTAGAYTLVFSANDGKETTFDTVYAYIGDVNIPPEISIVNIQTKDTLGNGETVFIKEKETLQLKISATDPNIEDTPDLLPLELNLFDFGEGNYNTSSGVFLFTPYFSVSTKDNDTTLQNITFRAKDSSYTVSFIIHVTVLDSNTCPIFDPYPDVSLDEDSALAIDIPGRDIDGDNLQWRLVNENLLWGKVDVTYGSLDSVAEFTYTPYNLTKNTSEILKLKISDGALQAEGFIRVTIIADNDPPEITTTSDTIKIDEDHCGYKVEIRGTDPESLSLTWRITKRPMKGTLQSIKQSLSPFGEATYVPDANETGNDNFSFVIYDGETESNEMTIPIVINEVNDPPIIRIIEPANGQQFDYSKDIIIKTTFSDIEDIDSVIISIRGVEHSVYKGSDTTYQYRWITHFNPSLIDTHSIIATVVDSDGIRVSDTNLIEIIGTTISDTLVIRAILDSNDMEVISTSEFINKFVVKDLNNRIISINYANPIDPSGGLLRKLQMLPREIRNLPQLSSLILDTNEINELPVEIGSLVNLSSLSLKFNSLNGVNIEEIGNLINLEKLDLSNNNLDKIPSSIENLSKLRFFDISDNVITKMVPEIGKLTDLEEFYCKNNKLNSIPPEIGNLSSLIILNLNNQSFTAANNYLPDSLGKLTNLERFKFRDNFQNSFPEGIQKLSKLKVLDFGNNRIDKINENICELEKLDKLYVDNNIINSISPNISQLKSLQVLDLGYNDLTTFHDSLCVLSNLSALYFNNNIKIESLPMEILNLDTNIKFKTEGCGFRNLPVETLKTEPYITVRSKASDWPPQ